MWEKCKESAKNAKICKESAKNAKLCKKVRNANAMRKQNQNSHRIASHYNRKKIRIFELFCIAFASHYHPWRSRSTLSLWLFMLYCDIQIVSWSTNLFPRGVEYIT
jgi:hypothetical protein